MRNRVGVLVFIASLAIQIPLAAQTFSSWTKVTNLGPIVNSSASDSCLFATKTGLSLYFASTRSGGSGGLDIYVSRRPSMADPWGTPANLGAVINTGNDDHLPFITPDGHTMIFASNRPGGLGLNDLYMSFRRNSLDDLAWESPVALTQLSSSGDDLAPWGFEDPTTGALTLFFASDRAGGLGSYDIYTSTLQQDGTFSAPALVPELSTSSSDTMPTIRADGLEFFLTSNRPGGLGGLDIWTSTRSSLSDHWSTPVNATALNSSAAEQRAGTFGDGRTVTFFSARTGGSGGADLYEATRTRTTIIPVAGSLTAFDGTVFKTSSRITNATDAEISGNLVFRPAGSAPSSSDPSVSYRLAPFETSASNDLMANFGVTGIGSIEIVPDSGSAPSSVFMIGNDAATVVVPPVEADNILVAGSTGAVTAPSDLTRYRLNVGFRTLDNGVTMSVAVHNKTGELVRSNTLTLPPNQFVQIPASALTQGDVNANESIVFSIESGSVIAYASAPTYGGVGSTLQLVRQIGE